MSVPALLALAPVSAAPASNTADEPPSEMSEVGGELLGRPGTQVIREDGAPQLPRRLSAKSWIVADAESGEVLAAHNAHWELAPASTIKMLFADLLLPRFEPGEEYVAEPEHFAGMGAGSSAVGISDGLTYTVEDLWHGVFLVSGNDAVHALLSLNGGKEKTAEEMNERARELQALDTHVVNPDGYDARGQHSSAYDLTLFARAGMQNPDFRDYASTATYDFPGAGEGAERETYQIQNTNRLLVGADGLEPYEGIAGIKNGYTSQAGSTFTGVAERGDRVLLVTVMDPKGDGTEVYREAAELLDWGFEAAGQVEPVGELVPPVSELPGDGEDGGEDGGETAGIGEAAQSAGAAAGASSSSDGGAVNGLTVAGVTLAGLAVVAAGAYVFRRRHPLPEAGAGKEPGTSEGGHPPARHRRPGGPRD